MPSALQSMLDGVGQLVSGERDRAAAVAEAHELVVPEQRDAPRRARSRPSAMRRGLRSRTRIASISARFGRSGRGATPREDLARALACPLAHLGAGEHHVDRLLVAEDDPADVGARHERDLGGRGREPGACARARRGRPRPPLRRALPASSASSTITSGDRAMWFGPVRRRASTRRMGGRLSRPARVRDARRARPRSRARRPSRARSRGCRRP